MDLLAGVPADFGTLALGLVLAGVVGGLIAGMLGVGGGIVVVPVLYHVLAGLGVPESMRMHVAVGTSLATIIPTSISSLRAHAAKGAVDWGLLKRWIGPMLLGVIAGSMIAGSVRGETLSLIFAIVAIPVAIHMAFDGAGRTISSQPPGGVTGAALPFGIGGISTMMGIGGGTVGVPLMTVFGMPIHSAVATASAFGAIISIPGTIGAVLSGWHLPGLPPYSFGYVNALGFVLIAPVSFFLAPVGAWLAHSVDRKRLRRMFALFIAVTAARMLWDVLF